MLSEYYGFSVTEIPAVLESVHAFTAVSRTFNRPLRDFCRLKRVLESDVRHRQIVRIFGDPFSPRREDDHKISRKLSDVRDVVVDYFVLLCEAQEFYFGELFGEFYHVFEVNLVDYVSARVVSEVSDGVELQPRCNVFEIPGRIIEIPFEVCTITCFVFREGKPALFRVAPFLQAGRVYSTSRANRKIDRRDHFPKLFYACRYKDSEICCLYKASASFFV